VPIIGTTPDMIDMAEDRERFQQLIDRIGLKQPPNRSARTESDALRLAGEIGYPLVVRPSYVLGGARDGDRARAEGSRALHARGGQSFQRLAVLLDRFLSDATEVDVDAASDGEDVLIGGVMEHIEQAGVHSGDSACSLPPIPSSAHRARAARQTVELAHDWRSSV